MDVKDAMNLCGPGSALDEYRKANPKQEEIKLGFGKLLAKSAEDDGKSDMVLIKCDEKDSSGRNICNWKVTSREPGLHAAGHRSISKHSRFIEESAKS